MEKGGDTGPALLPGKSGESLLLKTAAHQDEDLIMPPPGNKSNAVALTPDQLGLLRLWIDQGAKGGPVADAKGPLPWRARPAKAPVQAVAISPDGRLAAAARGNRVDLYELTTGKSLTQLTDPELSKLDPWKGESVADRDAVMSAAFGSDDLLATGGFRTIRLWRRMPRTVQRDLGALTETATCLAISPDGQLAAAGDGKGTVWMWTMAAEKFEPAPLREHSSPITALCFSPDGAGLVSTAEDKSVRVWDVAAKNPVLKGDAPAIIRSLVSLEGGKEVMAGCADGTARVWPWLAEPPEQFPPPKRELKLQNEPLSALADGAKGTFVWAAADGSLRTATVAEGKEQKKLVPEHPGAGRVAVLESELQVAQGLSTTRKAQLTAATTNAKKESDGARAAALAMEKARAEARRKRGDAEVALEAQSAQPGDKPLDEAAKKATDASAKAEAAFRAAKVNAELGARLASETAAAQAAAEAAVASADAAVPETQAALDLAKKALAEPAPPARHLFLHADSNTATIVATDGRIRHISLEDGALVEGPDPAGLAFLTPSGDLLCAGADKHIRLTTLRRRWVIERTIGNPEDPSILSDRVLALAFSPDGKLLASGGGTPSRDGELKIWRVSDGTPAFTVPKAHTDTINGLAFSPDGEVLATAASDRSARLWRTADASRIAILEGHSGQVLSTTWRADGLALATGGADRSVRLWDRATRRQTKNTNTFGGEVAAISYVGAGELLLTACGDKSLRLGDQALPEAAFFPFCAAADPRGRFVLIGGDDGILRMWTVADRKLQRTFTPASR
jgi:WD40 repeat protein